MGKLCQICGEPMPIHEQMFHYHGFSGPCPKPPLPKVMPITREDVGRFTFHEYRKISTTKLSDELLEAGCEVMTLEGKYTCAERSRLAIDAAGNVYPIAESIVQKTYERAEPK